MKRKIIFMFSLLLVGYMLCAAGSREKSSSSGKKDGGMQSIPQRTVTNNVVILQILDYLDVDVVAIPSTKRKIPERFTGKPEIGAPMKPDMERLKEVKPDCFLTVSNLQAALEPQLQTAKIPTVFLKTSNYTDLLDTILQLGKMYNKQEKANEYVEKVKAKVNAAKEKAEKYGHPRILIIGGFPNSMSFHTETSFVGSLAKVLGAENIWTNDKLNNSSVALNFEVVKAANPDLILITSHGSAEEVAKMFEQEFKNDFWSKLDAVKNKKVYTLDNEIFYIAGTIYIPEGLDILSDIFYGSH